MLRTGMTNFLKENADKGLAYICLGNEPHGGPEQVAKNVAAYKVHLRGGQGIQPRDQGHRHLGRAQRGIFQAGLLQVSRYLRFPHLRIAHRGPQNDRARTRS